MKNRIIFILSFFALGCLNAQTGFRVSAGTMVNLSGNVNLVLNDMDLENGESFGYDDTPTVIFSGSGNNGIYGLNDLGFYNLKISKTSGATLYLDVDILVENNLEMDQGKLDLVAALLTLDGGQIIGENEANYITGSSNGKIEYITVLNSPDQQNPGNLGIEITSIANLGQTEITRSHIAQTSSTGGRGIHRYYDISPANNSGLNATFRIYYNNSELNGIPESELEPWRSTDSGNTWELQEGSLLNTTNNWVQLSGVDAFSRWTLASESTASLPLELSYFKGKAMDHFNLLSWGTLSEENVSHFEIQKLVQNQWENIGSVEASHFSSDLREYTFEDQAYKNQEYYRLQMIDFDGKMEYSAIVSIEQKSIAEDLFHVYPNPSHDYLFLESHGDSRIDEVRIFDTYGKQVRIFKAVNDQLDCSDLAAGVYYLEAQAGTQIFIKKITKL